MSFRPRSIFAGRNHEKRVKVTYARPGYRKTMRVKPVVHVGPQDPRRSVYLPPSGSIARSLLGAVIPPVGYLR